MLFAADRPIVSGVRSSYSAFLSAHRRGRQAATLWRSRALLLAELDFTLIVVQKFNFRQSSVLWANSTSHGRRVWAGGSSQDYFGVSDLKQVHAPENDAQSGVHRKI